MIKTLAGSIRQYKKQTIMSPVTVALEVFFEIMIPLIMARLIDEGIDQGDMGTIWKYGIILLVVAIFPCFAVPFPVSLQHRHPPVFARTCVRICTTKCRIIPLPILISFQQPVWLHE